VRSGAQAIPGASGEGAKSAHFPELCGGSVKSCRPRPALLPGICRATRS